MFFFQALNDKTYLYVLDRNCTQFEPDHPSYIKIAHFVYDHINAHNDFDVLYSTRHYGPMVFYLTMKKDIEKLLFHYFKKSNLKDAVELVKLYGLIHPYSKLTEEEDPIILIRKFISNEAKNQTRLNIHLESVLETMAKNKEVLDELKDS